MQSMEYKINAKKKDGSQVIVIDNMEIDVMLDNFDSYDKIFEQADSVIETRDKSTNQRKKIVTLNMKNDFDTLNDFIYFFKFTKSNKDMHIYDIKNKQFSVHQMSTELPLKSKILTINNERMFIIGGLKGGNGSNRRKSLKLTWEYLLGTKNDLNQDIKSKTYSEVIKRENMIQERYD